MDSTNVMILSSDIGDIEKITQVLTGISYPHFQVASTQSKDRALHLLINNSYDVFLVDTLIGSYSGIDLIKSAISKGCRAPIILLTRKVDELIDEESELAGAVDFLNKNLDIYGLGSHRILTRALRYAVKTHNQLDKIQRSLEKVQEQLARISRDL